MLFRSNDDFLPDSSSKAELPDWQASATQTHATTVLAAQ
jgi:hypothetical protein